MKQFAFHAKIHGKVQGVGFRYYTVQEAKKTGVYGWVKNIENGDVEVWAEGSQKNIDSFLKWLYRGPAGARVSSIEKDDIPVQGFKEFNIEY
ncbi:MAG: acylphosphatase [Treponema sp.]|nr:acylphosphatase [Treponema sp.]